MCYSPQFRGWARDSGMSWVKNQSRHAKEAKEIPCISRLCLMVHLVGQAGETADNRAFSSTIGVLLPTVSWMGPGFGYVMGQKLIEVCQRF